MNKFKFAEMQLANIASIDLYVYGIKFPISRIKNLSTLWLVLGYIGGLSTRLKFLLRGRGGVMVLFLLSFGLGEEGFGGFSIDV